MPDFDTPKDREMAVFTHAKKLSEYIFVISEKSPVKFRWNIVSRLLNTSVDVIENLYHANYEKGDERVMWQKKAMVSLNLLDFYTESAKTNRQLLLDKWKLSHCKYTKPKSCLAAGYAVQKRKSSNISWN